MNDLLHSISFTQAKESLPDCGDDVEGGSSAAAVPCPAMENLAAFFKEVEEIKHDMRKLKQVLAAIEDASEESKTIHEAGLMKSLREKMDCSVGEMLKNAKWIKVRLENLDEANAANRRYEGCGYGSPIDRTRISVTHSLRKRLADIIGEFQFLRHRIVAEYRESVERRYFRLTGRMPDDETLERIIEAGESESFIQRAIHEDGRGHIIETVREIRHRHSMVREMERNLVELHQIFLDMAVLVESQGEQLNEIEHYIKLAVDFVDKGNERLRTAKRHQRSSRSWICFQGILLAMIALAVVAVPIVTRVRKSRMHA